MDKKFWITPLIILSTIGVLLLFILVPMAFGDLEFFEMGFVRNKATGTVDTSRIYVGGRHYIGVTKEFKTFVASHTHIQFKEIKVFNKEKMEVTLSCSLQYILRPEDLKILHDLYDVHYGPIIEATTLAALKGVAANYAMDEYRLNRTVVSEGLKQATSLVLDGGCCRKDCVKNYCAPGCKPYHACKRNEKGVYSSLTGFQLKFVDINEDLEKRFLRKVAEQELDDTEKFKQDEMVTRKETELQQVQIDNEANEILQNALVSSTLINEEAAITSKATVADARNEGLAIIHKKLNITNEEHKKTLDYVRTLRDHAFANMYIGFQYMVAKP